ncbi:MAG: trypsin-like peptidase domain-containing protein [Gemmatimonadales bacterium]|nr:trypsin-like peptidase domain-containing protein [Gemmatimonadales bacterium]
MGTSLSALAEAVWPSVVRVGPNGTGGAGVVLSRGGGLVVVTNAHVARGSPGDRIQVMSHTGVIYPGLIERTDGGRDLALLTLEPPVGSSTGHLSPATLADVATLRPGHLLIAVGHPYGLANAVTAGVVQSLGPIASGVEPVIGWQQLPWIQADIRLAPGNSGGPLCDMQGRVVGINTMVARGLALAIPASGIRALFREPSEAIPA